jgi:hypothetical protein
MKAENLVTRARRELHALVIADLRQGKLTMEAISIKHGLTLRHICKIATDNNLRRKDLAARKINTAPETSCESTSEGPLQTERGK